MKKKSRIWVAGHRGLVGSAIMRSLLSKDYQNIILKSKNELDLRDAQQVKNFFQAEKPEFVFLAAAKVGGIVANKDFPADFIRDNLLIQTNVIHSAYENHVNKLLFLGSTCIYPKDAPQPLKEEYLLTGKLESTNEAYAIAKIAGIQMCQAYNRQYGTNFISVMPTNVYGKNDNFDLNSSHVLPAMIHKFHIAKTQRLPSVEIWGTGAPRREFLYADDLADACLFLMENYSDSEIVNVGVGKDISIGELAQLIQKTIGYEGELKYNPDLPDGTLRKLVDTSRINELGWHPKVPLKEGITTTYEWFIKHHKPNA